MEKNILIKKFGGTSLGSIERIEAVADRICDEYKNGHMSVIVLSAMSGYTNHLIKMAENIYPKQSKSSAYDMLLASGEQISVSLFSMALKKRKIENVPLLGYQVGIYTDANFSSAQIRSIKSDKILEILRKKKLPIIAGFQGITQKNQITTLGRGGSDLTAVALAKTLKKSACEIYTDVKGVFTADPNLVQNASKIKSLGFVEMMEMSSLGSKILQSRSVEMAAKYDISIHVRHFSSKEEGTWIIKKENSMEGPVVSAIAHDLNTVGIKIQNTPKGIHFIADLFAHLGKASIFVDIISNSQGDENSNITFSIHKEDLEKVLTILEKIVSKDQISVLDNIAKISIIGVGMAIHSGVASRFFDVMKKLDIPIYLITTSEIKISAIIDEKHLKKVAKGLHKEFNLEG